MWTPPPEAVELTSGGVCSYSLSVSSTLNQSAKYAGKLMLDGRDDTCWSSGQSGSGQHIQVVFKAKVTLCQVSFMFQGGFVGQDATIFVGDSVGSSAGASSALTNLCKLELIADTNDMQTFPVTALASADPGPDPTPAAYRVVRIAFESSTDLYGRVTLYHLRLVGFVADAPDV